MVKVDPSIATRWKVRWTAGGKPAATGSVRQPLAERLRGRKPRLHHGDGRAVLEILTEVADRARHDQHAVTVGHQLARGHAGNRGLVGSAGGVFVAKEFHRSAQRDRGNLPAGAVAVVEGQSQPRSREGRVGFDHHRDLERTARVRLTGDRLEVAAVVDVDAAEQTAAALVSSGGAAIAVGCDVADADQVDDVEARILALAPCGGPEG